MVDKNKREIAILFMALSLCTVGIAITGIYYPFGWVELSGREPFPPNALGNLISLVVNGVGIGIILAFAYKGLTCVVGLVEIRKRILKRVIREREQVKFFK